MSDIKDTLLNFTRNAAKTSGDLIKTTRLSLTLSTEQENLKKLYVEIGKKVHEIYQYGGSLGKFFDEKYREIEACERGIENIKEQIGVIKGTRECPKCLKTVDRTAEFCPKCGIRVNDSVPLATDINQTDPQIQAVIADVPAPEVVTTPAVSQPIPQVPHEPVAAPKRNCRVCGAGNDSGVKFCLACGRLLD